MNNFAAILKLIGRNRTFVLATHHNPDADAIGSVLAMALFLKSLGKQVRVFNEDKVPQWLSFLPQTALVRQAKGTKAFDYDVAIVLDCGDLKRIGAVSALLSPSKPIVNIDHHITNDRFGSVNCIVHQSSSTSEILFDLFQSAKFKITKDIATLLYAGIMTDTGSFRYECTSAHTHVVAAHLMDKGVSAPDMYNRLYVGIPVKDMKLFTDVIHRAELLFNNQVYCVTLSMLGAKKFSKNFDLKEKLFGFLRSMEGVEVVVILTELSSKEVRVNLRSQGDFDVARFAQHFDGGGHPKAAGCKVLASLPVAKKKILSAIRKAL